MRIGATYSHHEIDYLKLDQNKSLTEVLDFGFDIIRLGAYWQEMEPKQGQFMTEPLSSILEQCQQRKQQVVLTVGMKAPRWPEFYIPNWVKANQPQQAATQAQNFIRQCITTFKHFDCIQAWQIENEPLDPSGPNNWTIPVQVLKEEVALVRELDPSRPIHLTIWGNSLKQRLVMPKLMPLADVIGLDLYYKVPATRWWYSGPDRSDKQLENMIANSAKPVWISELQAEPWEHGLRPSWLKPQSMNPQQLKQNYQRARQLNPQAIIFWGIEHWLLQKQIGRPGMWNAAKEVVRSHHR